MTETAIRYLAIKGRLVEVHRSRKDHKCDECGLLINQGDTYFSVTIAGGGLGSIKFPDRIHTGCRDSFLEDK